LFHFVPYRLFKSTCNSAQNWICFMWRCNHWTCPHMGRNCIFLLLAFIWQGKTTSSLLKYEAYHEAEFEFVFIFSALQL
jgi:hypothetical protein